MKLNEGETLEPLCSNLKIIQSKDCYRFSIDSVLLADFVETDCTKKLVDLGTGTGIIPLLLASKEEGLGVVGVELLENLAQMAARSVLCNKLEQRIRIICRDISGDLSFLGTEQWDIVTANPPYYPLGTGRISKNSTLAIARHEVKAKLKDYFAAANLLLKQSGSFYLVHRWARLKELYLLCKSYNLYPAKVQAVASRPGCEPYLVLFKCQKGVAVELTELPMRIIMGEGKSYNEPN